MNSHPCSTEHTGRLLCMANLSPCRILDMGAGKGETVAFLHSLGFSAMGIDINPFANIQKGNFLNCPFPDGSFDAVISECSFHVSGDEGGAVREAARMLKPGGTLLFADVCFSGISERRELLEGAGLRVIDWQDATADWKRFYAACLWNGTTLGASTYSGNKKCGYFLVVCVKPSA